MLDPENMLERCHSRTLIDFANQVGKKVVDVTPLDLLQYPHEDLPNGPPSPLGGASEHKVLKDQPESETRRLAEIGRSLVDASRLSRGLPLE